MVKFGICKVCSSSVVIKDTYKRKISPKLFDRKFKDLVGREFQDGDIMAIIECINPNCNRQDVYCYSLKVNNKTGEK